MGLTDSFMDIMRRCLAEFIGTFFLVFAVGMLKFAGALAPLVPGLTLTVIVFAFGHISMGVFNPAISLAFMMRDKLLSFKSTLLYVLSQLLAGVLGSLVAWGFGGRTIPAGGPGISLAVVFFAEFLGTFLLATCVLNSGTSTDYEGNSFFGLGIGGVLLAMVPVLGPVSGAVFNPAVGVLALFGPVHDKGAIPKEAWVYFVAPFLGAATAALAFRFISPQDHASREHMMRGPVDHDGHDHVHHHSDDLALPVSGKYEKLPANNDIN